MEFHCTRSFQFQGQSTIHSKDLITIQKKTLHMNYIIQTYLKGDVLVMCA